MSLKSEMVPYVDQYGLVMPQIGNDSTNGVLYTSEYMIALIRNKEDVASDLSAYYATINACMPTTGLLERRPDNAGGQEGPDDYYGLLAALSEIGCDQAKAVARHVVWYAFRHIMSMDNVNPGRFQWGAVLERQPQLDACALWAADLPVGPFLRLWTALAILTSWYSTAVDDTSSIRLAWLQVQVASKHSFIGRLAGRFWYWRLYKHYLGGMNAVNAIYFGPDHPLAKYTVDKAP